MKIEVVLSEIHVPIETWKKIIPSEVHLKKLSDYPILFSNVNKRIISMSITNSRDGLEGSKMIEGYYINDYNGGSSLGEKYFSIKDLDSLD